MNLTTFLILVIVSVFASAYGSITGGMALVLTPMLISLGLSPHMAVATSRTSSFFASFVTIYKFNEKEYYKYIKIL